MFNCHFIADIQDIEASAWNAICADDYPFIRYEFLHALESSGSLGRHSGWMAHHCVITDTTGELIGLMPMYLKTHSYGEYVFDWSWADAYHQHGLEYYPKLISAIPFTPATGPRLCHKLALQDDIDALYACISQSLNQHCHELNLSGWHILFSEEPACQQWQAYADKRIACHFQWSNQNFQCFDDFLQTFSSRKRKNLKKERKTVANQGIELRRLTGSDIRHEDWRLFHYFYQATYAKRSGHGGYLTAEFFTALQTHMADQVLLVMAYKDDKPIAAALNFFSKECLYGRYWGCLEEYDCLHFEACYYQGIEFCIEQGLQRFDPGVQGEHKIQRGFRPVISYSNHALLQPDFRQAVKHFLQQETIGVKNYQKQAHKLLPFKQQQ